MIERLALDLQRGFRGQQGFSPRNLKYMRAFAAAWPETIEAPPPAAPAVPPGKRKLALVHQPGAQLSWKHHCLLLAKLATPAERRWYAAQAVEQGKSRDVLAFQIDSALHLRAGQAVSNFQKTLPAPQSDLAPQIIKDPYVFDFLNLREAANERSVEAALMAHVEKFLLELGGGFALVGR